MQQWDCVLCPLLPCDWCRVSIPSLWVQVWGVGFCSTLRHYLTVSPWAGPSLCTSVSHSIKWRIGLTIWGKPLPLTLLELPREPQDLPQVEGNWGQPPCLAGWQSLAGMAPNSFTLQTTGTSLALRGQRCPAGAWSPLSPAYLPCPGTMLPVFSLRDLG